MRRFNGANLTYDYDPLKKATCARLHFSGAKRQFRSCLVENAVKRAPAVIVGWGWRDNVSAKFVALRMIGEELDTDFGTGGVTQVEMGVGNVVWEQGITKLPDGSYILATSGGPKKRLLSNGTEDTNFDPTFAGNGFFTLYDSTSFVGYNLRDGMTGIGSLTSNRVYFDGRKDNTYHSPELTWGVEEDIHLENIWKMTSGKFRMESSHWVNDVLGLRTLLMIQKNNDGTLDPTFGDSNSNMKIPRCVAYKCFISQSVEDGVLALFANSGVGGRLISKKFQSDGTPDPSYGNNGEIIGDPIFNYENAKSFQDYFYFFNTSWTGNEIKNTTIEIRKILNNATYDTTFGNNGLVRLPPVEQILPKARFSGFFKDGRILTTAVSDAHFGEGLTLHAFVTRPDGQPDTSAGPEGRMIFRFPRSLLDPTRGLATHGAVPVLAIADE